MGRFIPNENTYVGFATAGPGAVVGPTPTVTATGTIGTLAAVLHSYEVTVLTDAGESLPGAAGTHTNTLNDSNAITWSAVAGEVLGYKIYGRVAGSLALIGTVAHGILTFTDNGSIVIPASPVPPVTNKSIFLASPHVADVNNAIELTHYVMSLNFSAAGNVVPTPALDRLFESNIIGTSQATATADFYRDDEVDLAWETLPRGTKGYMIISRFGGKPNVAGDLCEVWPSNVVSRAMANMANNTVETFTVTFAVPIEPSEDSVVVA